MVIWYNTCIMKRHLNTVMALAAAIALAGCLGSHPKAPTFWTVDAESIAIAVESGGAKGGVVPARVAEVKVRPPWDVAKLAVRRADGSVAFDPFNAFAARPEALLKGPAEDVLASTGRYDVNAAMVGTNVTFNVVVTRLDLDCREEGVRKAEVALTLVANRREGHGAPSTSAAKGSASVDARAGDYSTAFSRAFTAALNDALKDL